jgi:hypothetical protein
MVSLTVKVLLVVPPATVNPVAAAVNVTPFTVLLVNASEPARVARVPVVGRVKAVVAVAVSVVANGPEVVRFPARLSEPVPKVRDEPEPAVVSRVPVVGSVTDVFPEVTNATVCVLEPIVVLPESARLLLSI